MGKPGKEYKKSGHSSADIEKQLSNLTLLDNITPPLLLLEEKITELLSLIPHSTHETLTYILNAIKETREAFGSASFERMTLLQHLEKLGTQVQPDSKQPHAFPAFSGATNPSQPFYFSHRLLQDTISGGLLTNAFKYNTQGNVTVTYTLEADESSSPFDYKLKVCVSNGSKSKLDPETLKQTLLEAGKTSGEQGGTGFGGAICNAILEVFKPGKKENLSVATSDNKTEVTITMGVYAEQSKGTEKDASLRIAELNERTKNLPVGAHAAKNIIHRAEGFYEILIDELLQAAGEIAEINKDSAPEIIALLNVILENMSQVNALILKALDGKLDERAKQEIAEKIRLIELAIEGWQPTEDSTQTSASSSAAPSQSAGSGTPERDQSLLTGIEPLDEAGASTVDPNSWGLFVDDNSINRALGIRQLTGQRVANIVTAENALDAMLVIEAETAARGQPPAYIITDWNMGNDANGNPSNGIDLLTSLNAAELNIPICCLSAFTALEAQELLAARELFPELNINALSKPARRAELLGVVDKMLTPEILETEERHEGGGGGYTP
jgi:CheY-like chemotaxis protein